MKEWRGLGAIIKCNFIALKPRDFSSAKKVNWNEG
jgi:hypothetical protein